MILEHLINTSYITCYDIIWYLAKVSPTQIGSHTKFLIRRIKMAVCSNQDVTFRKNC